MPQNDHGVRVSMPIQNPKLADVEMLICISLFDWHAHGVRFLRSQNRQLARECCDILKSCFGTWEIWMVFHGSRAMLTWRLNATVTTKETFLRSRHTSFRPCIYPVSDLIVAERAHMFPCKASKGHDTS